MGIAQIPLMIGLLLMAVALPAVTKLARQNQDNRNRATNSLTMPTPLCTCSSGSYGGANCPSSIAGKPCSVPSPVTDPCKTSVPSGSCPLQGQVKVCKNGVWSCGVPCTTGNLGSKCCNGSVEGRQVRDANCRITCEGSYGACSITVTPTPIKPGTCTSCSTFANQCTTAGGTVTSANGIEFCGYGGTATCAGVTGGGGDPCINNGGICSGTSIQKCKCGNSYVAVNMGADCDSACSTAGIPCNNSTCTNTEQPGSTPLPTNPVQIPTATPMPTTPPTPLACGEICGAGVPCATGLTCVTANNGGKYCSMPALTNACVQNPSLGSCCATSTTPPTQTPTPTIRILTPTPTPRPLVCGAVCGGTVPCATGLTCITANNGSQYCSMPANTTNCAANPNSTTCCMAITATPTSKLCKVGGKKFEDVNANRIFGSPDSYSNVTNWKFSLFKIDESGNRNHVADAVTVNGTWLGWPNSFQFTNLGCDGSYVIKEELKSGWTASGDFTDGVRDSYSTWANPRIGIAEGSEARFHFDSSGRIVIETGDEYNGRVKSGFHFGNKKVGLTATPTKTPTKVPTVTPTSTSTSCNSWAIDEHSSDKLSNLVKIDPNFTSITKVKSFSSSKNGIYNMESMDSDPSTGVLYVAPVNTRALYSVNTDSSDTVADGTLTKVASLLPAYELTDISFRPSDGTLWGWVVNKGLYQINKSTGVMTLKMGSKLDNVEGVAWDNNSEYLYLSRTPNSSPKYAKYELHQYNPSTNKMRFYSTLPGDSDTLDFGPEGSIGAGYLMSIYESGSKANFYAYNVTNKKVVWTKQVSGSYTNIDSMAVCVP